jgi:hypothetical protein
MIGTDLKLDRKVVAQLLAATFPKLGRIGSNTRDH